MGLFSLAASGCRIDTRTAGGDCWRTTLEPDHFRGTKTAEVVEGVSEAPEPCGTRIEWRPTKAEAYQATMRAADWARAYYHDIENAAMYVPIRVTLNNLALNQMPFLTGCTDVSEWNGIRIGVCPPSSLQNRSLNYYGKTVPYVEQAPVIQEVVEADDGRLEWNLWTCRFDVQDCPDLELTLPTRSRVVHNKLAAKLEITARRAIYLAMAKRDEAVRLSARDLEEAKALGIRLDEPPRTVLPWRPRTRYHQTRERTGTGTNRRSPAEDDVRVPTLGAHIAQVFWRAAIANGWEGRLITDESALYGYQWYEELPTMNAIHAVTSSGREKNGRVAKIIVLAEISGKAATKNVVMDTDVNLPKWPFYVTDTDDIQIELTTRARIDEAELTAMLMDAYCPTPRTDRMDPSDPRNELRRGFHTRATARAGKALGGDNSPKMALAAAASDLCRHVPAGHRATIRIDAYGDIKVEVDAVS